MENNKQEHIEEMVSILEASNNPFIDVPIEILHNVAEVLYNAGYRKVSDSEAVKEFAEKLKEKVHNYYPSIDSYCTSRHVILVKDIDELLKEYEK